MNDSMIALRVTEETHAELMLAAGKQGVSVPGLIMLCVNKVTGIEDGIARRPLLKHKGKDLVVETTPSNNIIEPRTSFTHEAREYWCPVCKKRMEETDRRDITDQYGETRYHSCELTLECPSCSNGMGITLSFPYID